MREDNSKPMDVMRKMMTVDISALESYAEVRDKLFIRLSPVNGSEAIRESSPYREVDDLLITYHIAIKASDDGFMSARITNKMLADYGITAEKLRLRPERSKDVWKSKDQSGCLRAATCHP